jgi:hypothetical protein
LSRANLREIASVDTLSYEQAIAKYGDMMNNWDGAIELSLKLSIWYNSLLLLSDTSKIEELSTVDDHSIIRIEYLNKRKPNGCIRVLTK